MNNMIDYVKEFGIHSFKEKQFNEVDALIFAQISYYQWENVDIELSDTFITLQDAKEYVPNMLEYTFKKSNGQELYDALIQSKRFSNIKVGHFIKIDNQEKDEQFAAISILYDDQTIHVSFRGTDTSIVGWKEDFNLAFLEYVTSQLDATKYIYRMQAFGKKIRVMGHSKGGNLATYVGYAFCDTDTILHIYNFDGPGFVKDAIDETKIQEFYTKYIPQDSIIGLAMQENNNFQIVKSNAISIFQHDPFTWSIVDGHFEFVDHLEPFAEILHKSSMEWLSALTPSEKNFFFGTIFNTLLNQKQQTFDQLHINNWIKIIEDFYSIDKESKEAIGQLVKMLFDIQINNSKEALVEHFNKINFLKG